MRQFRLGDSFYSTRRGSALNHLIAAIGAGSVTATLTSPLWVVSQLLVLFASKIAFETDFQNAYILGLNTTKVKTRYQTHSVPTPTHGEVAARYRGVLATIFNIAQQEGPRALFKGLGVSMLGLVHVAIQFPLYEDLKQRLSGKSTLMDCSLLKKIRRNPKVKN